MKLAAVALMFCFAASPALAQEIYRCGSAYSQTPCPQGRLVEADDSRSEAQRAEASRVATRERQLATEMRRDRLAEEAAFKPALAGSLSAPKVASAATPSPPKKKRGSAKPAAPKELVISAAGTRKKRFRS
ncbi:MAG: hypothetical protein ABL916_06475 [Burkholderiaceae bacterium]